MTQNLYSILALTGTPTFAGAAGTLPGASAMSAGVVVRFSIENASSDLWGNLAGGAGWKIGYSYSNGIYSVVVTINGTATTIPLGSVRGSCMFLSFTLNATALVVYANGQRIGSATLGGAVTPSAGSPTITLPTSDAIISAFYHETTLTAGNMSTLFFLAELWAGLDQTALPLQHLYDAVTSERPLVSVFEDIGSTGGVNLTATSFSSIGAVIFPADFGQPVASVTGATGATGATGPTGP